MTANPRPEAPATVPDPREELAEAISSMRYGWHRSELVEVLWEIFKRHLAAERKAREDAERKTQEWQDLLDRNVSSLGKELSALGRERDALAAQVAALREALTNILPSMEGNGMIRCCETARAALSLDPAKEAGRGK